MENRKIQSRGRYLLAFLIATLLFLLIFTLSYSIAYFEFQRVSGIQGDVAYSIFEDKLDYSLFNSGNCSEDSFNQISQDLGFQGRIIDDLERKFGKNNNMVLEQKKFYVLVELEHFEFVKLVNEKCNKEINTILFFYSNEGENIDESELAGDVLGVVANRNKDLVIYSFDVNLNSELVKKLKQEYNIKGSPSVVVNGGAKIENSFNVVELEYYLK